MIYFNENGNPAENEDNDKVSLLCQWECMQPNSIQYPSSLGCECVDGYVSQETGEQVLSGDSDTCISSLESSFIHTTHTTITYTSTVVTEMIEPQLTQKAPGNDIKIDPLTDKFTITSMANENGSYFAKSGWSKYINKSDSDLDVDARINGRDAAFCGFSSKHDSDDKDRLFRFMTCEKSDGMYYPIRNSNPTEVTSRNNWDERAWVDCPQNSVVTRIVSEHSNWKEDRKWQFTCSEFSGLKTKSCDKWTDYWNGWKQDFNYDCDNDYVMTGIDSYHDNSHEDRKFKFKCCPWEYDGCLRIDDIPSTHATPGMIKYNKGLINNGGVHYPVTSVATFVCPYNPMQAYLDSTTCQDSGSWDKDPVKECGEWVQETFQETGFRLLPSSFDECPASMYLSEEDCIRAGLALGGTLRGDKLIIGWWSNKPFGCSFFEIGENHDLAIAYNAYPGKNDGISEPVCSKGSFTLLPKSFKGGCPSSMNISKEDCAAAALSAGGNLRHGKLVEVSWDHAPYGCFITADKKQAHYNSNGVNDGNYESLCHELLVSEIFMI